MATKKVQKIEKIHNTQKPGKLRFDNTRGTLKQLSIEPVIFSDSDSHHEGDREVSLVLSFALPTAPSPYSQQGGSL